MPPDAIAPGWAALKNAQALRQGDATEQAWIAALSKRYSADPKADRGLLNANLRRGHGRPARHIPMTSTPRPSGRNP